MAQPQGVEPELGGLASAQGILAGTTKVPKAFIFHRVARDRGESA
jgi:hypothetical protein